MKKNILIKAMGMAMACALVFGNNTTALTAHAATYGDDGAYHGDGRDGTVGDDTSISIGGGSSNSGSSGSPNSGGGTSYSAPSYDDGAYHGDGRDGTIGDSVSVDIGGGSTASAPAPTGLATKGNTASIQGYETFRQIYSPADGKASIYHKGIEQYTAQLKDADGNAVAYKYASPYKDETTGLWYLNIVTAEGVDTTGYTVGTYKGSVTYLPTLGMQGVMLNQVLAVDAAAK